MKRRTIWVRPSSAQRWAGETGCPASVTYEPPAQGSSETVYTLRGTRIHDYAAWLMDPERKRPHVNQEERETANHMVALLRDAVDTGSYEWVVERKIGLDIGGVLLDGTPDLVGVHREDQHRPIEIIDYKAGLGVLVQAEGNMQLLTYALLALKDERIILPGVASEHPGFNCRIIQPASTMHGQPPVKTVPIPHHEVEAYHRRLEALMDRLTDPTRVLEHRVSPSNCAWCHAKPRCTEFSRTGKAVLHQVERGMDPESSMFSLPVDEWARFLAKFQVAEQMAREVERAAERRLRDGLPVPGMKLIQVRLGQRKWGDPGAYANDMARAQGELGPIFLHEPRLKTPAQMEREVKRLDANDTQVELRERMEAVIRDHTVRTPPVTQVVSEADPRPAIGVQGALAHFPDRKPKAHEQETQP